MIFCFNEKKPTVGKGTYVSDSARVVGDVAIGENCYVGHGVIIRGDYGKVKIDSGSVIEEGVILQSPPEDISHIGHNVIIGPGAVVHSISIGNNTVIGIGSVLGLNSQIGKSTIVAEGSVTRTRQIVPNNMVVGGNPVRTIREVTDIDRENWIQVRELYMDLAANYLKGAMVPLTQL